VKRALLTTLLTGVAALAAAPAASAARVDVLVVGKSGVLRGPTAVTLKPRTVKVRGHRCAVGRATPLSVLAGARLRLKVRDQGACGRNARDAAGLYVYEVAGQRERGRSGWVYKVGNRAGTSGAGDPAGPFGDGRRLRAGQHVLWFWCTLSSGGCQRTLDVRPQRGSAAPGESLRVTVRGYDDFGAAIPVGGATVRLGPATATTGADGVAALTVPSAGGRTLRLRAERAGMVPAFPRKVAVR
jgi:hypothetical protein